ncbi:MAG: COX15/CtaA family protein [Bacteroidota bacterium]|nr:COX15/CtaA family protein [Bacteroidota bacterium]
MKHHKNNIFIKIGITSIIAVYFLILVGGIVRSTGSGMGCPDWPKCFGSWVPPTNESQLPENYKEVYSQKRKEKNNKIANYLEALGFSGLAFQIKNEESVSAETDFNSVKTWIEYLNRLVGVVIGLLIIATFITSFRFIGKDISIFVFSFFALVLVVVQGWIGSLVVSTNLLPWMVTVHMLLAFVLIAVLIYAVFKAGPQKLNVLSVNKVRLNLVIALCIITIILQTILGTQVREAIDQIALTFDFANRNRWIEKLGMAFYIHRSFSILVLALHLYLVFILYKNSNKNIYILNLSKILFGLVIWEVFTGVVLAYFAIPAFLQPIHLLLATIIFGIQFYFILLFNVPSITEIEGSIIESRLVKA